MKVKRAHIYRIDQSVLTNTGIDFVARSDIEPVVFVEKMEYGVKSLCALGALDSPTLESVRELLDL